MELRRNLRNDPVSRLQPTSPLTIEAVKPIAAAVDLLREKGVGCLLVTRAAKVVGIFTERDLLTKVIAGKLPMNVPIAEVMTSNPVTVTPTDTVRIAVKRMQQGSYRHLPVVGEDGSAVGVLSAKRVMRYLAEHYPNTVYALPDPNDIPATAEGA